MKSIDVIFKQGQMYEKDSDRLISLHNNSEAVLIVSDLKSVVFETKQSNHLVPLDSRAKAQLVKSQSDSYLKIVNKGSLLYSHIPVQKTSRLMTVELLEDLYLYHKESWKSTEATIFSCLCQVVHVEGAELDGAIKASSLNELYKEAYLHFNLNKGNAARNAFDAFHLDPKDKSKDLRWVRSVSELIKTGNPSS
jgi:hypothetical protein